MGKRERIRRARNAGSITSEAKAIAVRENGKKGGRPGNPAIKLLMAERGITRQRAHQILRSQSNT